jgi:hypothetical protein
VSQAADLTFTPEIPIVQIGQQLTLSVSGATGEVIWTVINGNGQIVGSGNQVTYIPDQVGLGIVAAVDKANNNAKMVNITVTATAVVSLEKATWEVFTSRSWITSLQLSEKHEFLWVGTDGGLEKRDAETGELKRVFMKSDGLPDNWINALIVDDSDELWVGTDKGLAHFRADDRLEILKTDNSGLPSNMIKSLLTIMQRVSGKC